MRIATGIVVDGKVVTRGEPLPDGTEVTVLARDDGEFFELPAELEAELLESLAQADRGEVLAADEVLRLIRYAS